MHFFNRYNVERETHRLEKIRGEQKKNLDTIGLSMYNVHVQS